MKIFQINGGVFGSTGKIMFDIAETARQEGHEVLCAAPITSTNRNKQPGQPYLKIGSFYGRCLNVLLTRLTGCEGCFAVLPTLQLLKQIDQFQPDVLHIHSIHNSYLNIPMLFRYIKRNNIRVVWTLHDCWAFTGHCAHFDMIGCEKWKTGCRNCPQYQSYPKTYRDNSKVMYTLKKKWFQGIRDLTIVTPSNWLAGLVKQSFLHEYPVHVIPNGIDLSIFQPRESDFRRRIHCEEKKIVLGVSFVWIQKKGLDVFIELARRLGEQYQIVLVGTDEQVEKQLPDNIIAIRRTQNQQELAEIYTAADVFVNPSVEETMGLVTVEALACGTPAVVFNKTAVPEVVDENCGIVVEAGDIEALIMAIMKVDDFAERNGRSGYCLEKSKSFEARRKFRDIIELYANNYKV